MDTTAYRPWDCAWCGAEGYCCRQCECGCRIDGPNTEVALCFDMGPTEPIIEVVPETVDGYTDHVLQGVDAIIDSTERAMGFPAGWSKLDG